MVKSSLRKASFAALLGVVACAAQPPPPAPTPASPPVASIAAAAAATPAAPPGAAPPAAKGEGQMEGAAADHGDGERMEAAAAPAGSPGVGAARGAAAARAAGPMLGGQAGAGHLAPIPVTAADPQWGSKTALVTIVEYSDFQCPFCARLATTFEQLKQSYGPTQLRIVWKNSPLPFHADARPAAEAGMAIFQRGGPDAFWAYHAAVYRLGQPWSAQVYLDAIKTAGFVAADVTSPAARGAADQKIDADLAEGRSYGVTGTPASFINGISLSGAQPPEAFTAIIDDQVIAAKALLRGGTAPDRVYAQLSAVNFAKAPPPPKPHFDAPAADDTSIWSVPIAGSPVRGKATAPVTMVMFTDFQCPFCIRVSGTVASLEKEYGDKLRVVYKSDPLPFHPRAEPAAELAFEARAQKGDAGFWKVQDLLWIQNGKLDDQDLEGVASVAGLSAGSATAAIQAHKHKAKIDQDQELADDVQASGTPHFFINGRRLVGAQPIEKFREVIDEQLKVAEALIAKGTAAAKVYDEILKGAKTAPLPEKKQVPVPTKDNPSKGPANAKVTVQIFADFQCPFCKRANPTLDELDAAFPGKIRFVWRNLPLPMHVNAELAAEAAMEAWTQKGAAGFWKMHDLLFDGQAVPGGLERPALDQYAAIAGLDLLKFAAALDGHTHRAAVQAEAKLAADAQISGTPSFVINGYWVSGAQPLTKFKHIVNLVLAGK